MQRSAEEVTTLPGESCDVAGPIIRGSGVLQRRGTGTGAVPSEETGGRGPGDRLRRITVGGGRAMGGFLAGWAPAFAVTLRFACLGGGWPQVLRAHLAPPAESRV